MLWKSSVIHYGLWGVQTINFFYNRECSNAPEINCIPFATSCAALVVHVQSMTMYFFCRVHYEDL